MGAIITYQRGLWDCRAVVIGPDVKYQARLSGYWFPMSEEAAPKTLRSAVARELAARGSCEHCRSAGGGCSVCGG